MNLVVEARGLLVEAAAAYAGDAVASARIADAAARLRDPLRLGIAGMVKAGKSTLLNALLGEKIAPTDAGECTRTVTWYRYGDTPEAAAHLAGGGTRRLALRRSQGRLQFDLGELSADDVERIEVRWPSAGLRSLVLIDTPGIESASERVSLRTRAFLTPDDDAPSGADAILYLLRHLHPSDVSFLEAFRDSAAGSAHALNALAVLSRADEVGAGRIDALLSARKIADRYRADPRLRAVALTVVPVAGLLAETARTLREREFQALRAIAGLDRATRESLLLSVDRLTRDDGAAGLDAATRRALVERLGIAGIRLSAALVRGGARSAQRLSEQLVQQSGLEELRGQVQRHFRAREAVLKVRSVLVDLDALARERPRAAALEAGIERLAASSHELRELDLLARARTTGLGMPPDLAAEAERILGAAGPEPAARLGLPATAPAPHTLERALVELDAWRARAHAPLTTAAEARTCEAVVRSLEGVVSEVRGAGGRGGTAAHVDAAGGPPHGAGQQPDEQSEQPERGLQRDDRPQRVG